MQDLNVNKIRKQSIILYILEMILKRLHFIDESLQQYREYKPFFRHVECYSFIGKSYAFVF